MKRFSLVALVVLSIFTSAVPAQAIDLGASSNYLVRITPEARTVIERAITQSGGKINERYQYVFDGFLIRLPDFAAAALRRIPNVLSLEKDEAVELSQIQFSQSPTASWGLDRIDQREPLGSTSSYGYRSGGKGATIYVLDTGVSPHDDFQGRLSNSGFSAISDGNGPNDCHGHGTHVAGTAAGTKYGVAKFANIVSVRILNCAGSGMFSQVISGMEWILSPQNPNPKTQAVVNMSIGGSASSSIDAGVTKLTNSGIVVVAAAGNERTDACTRSPARAPSAITVGATERNDVRASYSNFGSCVDIFAPGSSITSAWHTALNAERTINGTSMASPHVAGAAAIYLGLTPSASVAQVAQFIDAQATRGAIIGLPDGTVNELLYVSPTDGFPAIVPPTVALRTVSAISHESALVNIDVNPGNAPTSVSFEYGTTADLSGATIKVPVNPANVSGGSVVSASVQISNLLPNVTYYFRITGSNESGATVSPIGNFKTLTPPKTLATPIALAPTEVTAYSATLRGTVNPGSDTTQVSFVYGTDPNFKENTKTGLAIPASVSGWNPIAVSLPISFLEGGLNYYVQVVSSNSSGSATSATVTFQTPKSLGKPPIVSTKPNGYIFSTSKVNPVQGTVNPQGQTTVVSLVYGPDSSLTSGQRTISVGTFTGETDINLTAEIPAASTPGGRIWYRFDAYNASGVTRSVAQTNGVEIKQPFLTSQRVDNSRAGQATLWATGDAQGSNTRWSFIYSKSPNLFSISNSGAFTLAPGAIEVKANPEARVAAGSFTTSAVITGLENGTTYYYVVKIVSLGNGYPWQDRPTMGTVGTWQTLNVAPAPTPTSSQTPRPSVSPTPAPSPTPTPTPGVRSPQTITFPALANRFVQDSGTRLLASASSRLPITYSVVGPCQVYDLGGGVFSTQPRLPLANNLDSFTCTFTASQAGNSFFAAATPVSQTMLISRQSMKIDSIRPSSIPISGAFLYASASATEGRPTGAVTGISFANSTPTICSLAEQTNEEVNGRGVRITVRARTNGTCTIVMNYAGDASYKPASATWSMTISGINSPAPGSNAAQTITFPALVDWDKPGAQLLGASASSGLPITYLSLTPDICSILNPGRGAVAQRLPRLPDAPSWSCTIRATQSGDDRFAPAVSVDRTFRFLKAPMVLTSQGPASIRGAGPHQVITTVAMVDRAAMSGLLSLGHLLTATSLTPTVCSISSHGTWDRGGGQGIVNRTFVTGLINGECQIRFDFAGTLDRAPATTTWRGTISGLPR